MGLQKYRADQAGPAQKNGGIPFYCNWMGGPTLALIRNCKIENKDIGPRTVYIRGEADTFFSIPAACTYKGKTVTGYVTSDDSGEYVFRAHTPQCSGTVATSDDDGSNPRTVPCSLKHGHSSQWCKP